MRTGYYKGTTAKATRCDTTTHRQHVQASHVSCGSAPTRRLLPYHRVLGASRLHPALRTDASSGILSNAALRQRAGRLMTPCTVVLVNINHQIGLFSCMFLWLTWSHFFIIATVKTRRVLKRAWQGLLTEGYPNMKRLWGMMKKSCFSHDLKTWDFKYDAKTFNNLYIFFCWRLLPCSFQNRSCCHFCYNQNKSRHGTDAWPNL